MVSVGGVFKVERGRLEREETVVSRMRRIMTRKIVIIAVGLRRDAHAIRRLEMRGEITIFVPAGLISASLVCKRFLRKRPHLALLNANASRAEDSSRI